MQKHYPRSNLHQTTSKIPSSDQQIQAEKRQLMMPQSTDMAEKNQLPTHLKCRQPFCQQNELATARDLIMIINLIRSFQSSLATTGGKQIVRSGTLRPRIHHKQSNSKNQ